MRLWRKCYSSSPRGASFVLPVLATGLGQHAFRSRVGSSSNNRCRGRGTRPGDTCGSERRGSCGRSGRGSRGGSHSLAQARRCDGTTSFPSRSGGYPYPSWDAASIPAPCEHASSSFCSRRSPPSVVTPNSQGNGCCPVIWMLLGSDIR